MPHFVFPGSSGMHRPAATCAMSLSSRARIAAAAHTSRFSCGVVMPQFFGPRLITGDTESHQ
jgi:hypothetical protein